MRRTVYHIVAVCVAHSKEADSRLVGSLPPSPVVDSTLVNGVVSPRQRVLEKKKKNRNARDKQEELVAIIKYSGLQASNLGVTVRVTLTL